jgi:hypothetical protein
MYAMKLALTVKDRDNNSDEKEKEEDRSMLLKYLELHLERMLKCYTINDERIDTIFKQLNEHYDQLDMHDEELQLSKKLLELYRQDDTAANAEKITELLKNIATIYLVHKNDRETAEIYLSQLEEQTSEEDPETVDDFIIDYRQSEGEEVHAADVVPPLRRWSTVD